MTPKNLPNRRRRGSPDDDRLLSRTWVRGVLVVLGLAGSTGTGYYSGLAAISERVAVVEARQAEQYKAVLSRLDEVRNDVITLRDDVRADINGTRGEIMSILRERQR